MYKTLLISFYLSLSLQIVDSLKCPKSLKKSLVQYRTEAPRKPITSSQNSTCNLQSTCCTVNMEREVREQKVVKVKESLVTEIREARRSLDFIKTMTAGQIKDIIKQFVPADLLGLLDVNRIAELIWAYSLGEIDSHELIVEVAVVGKEIIFNENASQELRDMVECVIRELADHAHEAFGMIARVAEDLLEAPRTFGKGFTTIEVLFVSMENSKVSKQCQASLVYGCHACGVKLPPLCHSTCTATTTSCVGHVIDLGKRLWDVWVDSITKLVDAMLLLKDIEIDPTELLDKDMIDDLLVKIQISMMRADIKKCLPYKARVRRSHRKYPTLRKKRNFSQSQMLKGTLTKYFSDVVENNCKSASNDNNECWQGGAKYEYSPDIIEDTSVTRETKSNTEFSEAANAINDYKNLVDDVSKRINEKVKRKRKYDY